jgi:hypothetical protein
MIDFKALYKYWFIGSYNPLEGMLLDVPDEIINLLQEDMRPIMSTCLKAIEEDQRELTLTCLDEIVGITSTYLNRRKNYPGGNDRLLYFISGQLEILFNMAVRVPNQQYTTDIVNVAGQIASKCAELSSTQLTPDQNSLAGIWDGFLERAVINSLHLQHTSAPPDAIKNLYTVGIKLIQEGAITSSVFGMADSLTRIGANTSKYGGAWFSLLSQRCIYGLLVMLYSILYEESAGKYADDIYISKLCEDIEKIALSSFDTKMDYMSHSTLVAPLVGSLWQDLNLIKVFQIILSPKYDGQPGEGGVLDRLNKCNSALRRIGAKSIEKIVAGKLTPFP